MAGELEQNIGGSEAVFGDYAKTIQGYAKESYASLGTTESDYLATANKMGSLFKGAGFEVKDAMDMTSEGMQRAADVASIMGLDMGAAMESVAGMAKGNFTMMDNLGVAMNDTSIKAYALANQEELLAKGLNVTAKEMDTATKIGVAHAMFMDKTAEYAGNYAKENETFSGSLTTLKANFGNLATTIGGEFLPLLTPLIQKANEMVNSFRDIYEAGGIQAVFSEIGAKISEISPMFATIVDVVQRLGEKLSTLSPGQLMQIGGAILGFGPTVSIVGKLVSGLGTIATIASKASGAMSALKVVMAASSAPIGLIVAGVAALVAAFIYLWNTNEGFRESIMSSFQTIAAAVMPVVQSLMDAFKQIGGALLQVGMTIADSLAPAFTTIIECIAQVVAALAPLISQFIDSLLPVIMNIIEVVTNIVEAVMPTVISIIQTVSRVIQSLMPVIQNILSVVVSVIQGIMSVISPIISFIGMIISAIMGVISPIVSFIGNVIASIASVIGTILGVVTGIFSKVFSVVSGIFQKISSVVSTVINTISSIINTLSGVFSKVFNGIYTIVSGIMNKVKSVITGVFNAIKSAWSGLTSFVGGIFDGISSAVSTVVNAVKGFVNGVIRGINAAIGLINMIPGVSIGAIPYLLHGTDDWPGGFARMNEGGRGELTYLPNGTQVIPHDISVKYAKEAARVNNAGGGGQAIDYDRLIGGIARAMGNVRVQNTTTLNGKVLASETTPLINRNMGDAQAMEERYA